MVSFRDVDVAHRQNQADIPLKQSAWLLHNCVGRGGREQSTQKLFWIIFYFFTKYFVRFGCSENLQIDSQINTSSSWRTCVRVFNMIAHRACGCLFFFSAVIFLASNSALCGALYMGITAKPNIDPTTVTISGKVSSYTSCAWTMFLAAAELF